MNLTSHQRELRRLICDGPELWADASDYARTVAASQGLRLAREIIQQWRASKIERYARLTSQLLKQLGSFDETVRRFAALSPPSAYIEAVGHAFLLYMSSHDQPLIASVAQFEAALIHAARSSDEVSVVVRWPCDPEPILGALLDSRPLPAVDGQAEYQTVVSRSLPSLFEVRHA